MAAFWTIHIFIPNEWRAASSRSTPRNGRDRHVVGLVVERVAGSFAAATSSSGEWGVADAKEKILLISGKYDEFITKEDSEGLWTSWEKPTRLVMPCGHSGMNIYRKPR